MLEVFNKFSHIYLTHSVDKKLFSDLHKKNSWCVAFKHILGYISQKFDRLQEK